MCECGNNISCTERYDGTSWSSGCAMITARRGIGGGGNQSAAFAGAGFSTANVTCTEEYS